MLQLGWDWQLPLDDNANAICHADGLKYSSARAFSESQCSEK
jgi:hypothetical protein